MALLTRASLDLYDAATLAGDKTAFDRAAELLQEVEKGYLPLVYALQTEAGWLMDDLIYAREHLDMLKRAATECGNDWGLKLAAAFEEAFSQREQES